ncbi:alanine:cation symporter family protein, partial [Staphylococcus saprophyticus]|uniref:alanine:cation symporter family protein n=1 Tax=Staphylococcus saprophyticus TaxID=29385 RepID=UPI00177DEFC4
SNTVAQSLKTQYNLHPIITPIILPLLTPIIIFPRLPTIPNLSSLILPLIPIIYIPLLLLILIINYHQIIPIISTIIKTPFPFQQLTRPPVRAAILQPLKPPLFSNQPPIPSPPNPPPTPPPPH